MGSDGEISEMSGPAGEPVAADQGRRSHWMAPSGVAALAAAVAAVSGIAFGFAQLIDNESGAPNATQSSVLPTTSEIVAPSTPSSLKRVADEVISFDAPVEWHIERSYDSDGLTKTITADEHVLVATTHERSDDGWFEEQGFSAAVAVELLPSIDELPGATEMERLRTFLNNDLDWSVNCDPQNFEIEFDGPGYSGLLRSWERCGPTGEAVLVDGLIVSDNRDHTVMIQLRPGAFATKDLVDRLVGSVRVDVEELESALATRTPSVGDDQALP